MRLVPRIASFLAAVCLLTACAPKGSPTSPALTVEQLASTFAAGTIAAGATKTAATTPTAPAPTPTIQPTLFINAATSNCRSGPGADLRIIATFTAGMSVNLIGRDSSDNYWIAQDPASRSPCWIPVQDGTPAGSFDLLPEMTPQPISVAAPVQPGSSGRPNFACDNSTLTTILAWQAPPGPVNGYRIYREGNQVADVPATQTTYTEKIPFIFGSSVQYAVAAYNDAGASPQRKWTVHCP